MKQGLERLVQQGSSSVVVVGSGEIADMFIAAIEDVEGLELAGVITTGVDTSDNGEFRLLKPEKLSELEFDNVVIADIEFAEDLVATCKRLGVEKEQLWVL